MSIYNRANPFFSHIKERIPITKEGTEQKVFHIVLDLLDSGIVYRPGDSLAILPANDPNDIEPLLQYVLKPSPDLIEFLTWKADLYKVSTKLLQALQVETLPKESYIPATLFATRPDMLFSEEQFCTLFAPLLPRFYSIASSQSLYPEEAHLMVAEVSYLIAGKRHYGVASGFLCDRAVEVPLYLQPTANFSLPKDNETSIILIGAGTGIAPYRSFLQERIAKKARGRNWLFLGSPSAQTDFYYEELWNSLKQEHNLTLTCAFSRDTPQKVYVQHKMWEERHKLWTWMREGALLYVCGDAQGMGKGVDEMLEKIIAAEEGISQEEARRVVKTLRAQKRYLKEVY